MAVKDLFSAETIAEFDVRQVASRHFRALFITTFCGARRVLIMALEG